MLSLNLPALITHFLCKLIDHRVCLDRTLSISLLHNDDRHPRSVYAGDVSIRMSSKCLSTDLYLNALCTNGGFVSGFLQLWRLLFLLLTQDWWSLISIPRLFLVSFTLYWLFNLCFKAFDGDISIVRRKFDGTVWAHHEPADFLSLASILIVGTSLVVN